MAKGSPFLFVCFALLLSLLGLAEYNAMTLPERKLEGVFASIAGACLPLAVVDRGAFGLLGGLTFLVIVSALVFLFRFRDIRQAAGETALLCFGFLYVPLLLSHLILLRLLPAGVHWIFLLLVIVMCGDSAAYYVGSSIGRTRLYEAVSPKKSVEGAIGGIGGSLAGAFIYRYVFFPGIGVGHLAAMTIATAVLAQLGDLFESLLKRSCGVKDSGTIVPGHGGILDRLDSILFAAPVLFYYVRFVVPGY